MENEENEAEEPQEQPQEETGEETEKTEVSLVATAESILGGMKKTTEMIGEANRQLTGIATTALLEQQKNKIADDTMWGRAKCYECGRKLRGGDQYVYLDEETVVGMCSKHATEHRVQDLKDDDKMWPTISSILEMTPEERHFIHDMICKIHVCEIDDCNMCRDDMPRDITRLLSGS